MKLSAKRTRVKFSIFNIISSWMASQIFFLLLIMIDQDGLVWRSCLKLYQEKFLLKPVQNNYQVFLKLNHFVTIFTSLNQKYILLDESIKGSLI